MVINDAMRLFALYSADERRMIADEAEAILRDWREGFGVSVYTVDKAALTLAALVDTEPRAS
jgi:hypothetical protein